MTEAAPNSAPTQSPPTDNPLAYDARRPWYKNLINLVKQSFGEWSDDKAPTFAASLAYYTVFSLAPILLIALAVAGAVFGDDAARGAVQSQLSGIIGASAAKTVQDAMASASTKGSGVLATIIGIVVTVFAATGVFAELQNALNAIWKVKPKPTSTVLAFLKTRFLSLAVVMGIGFLLLVSLVVSAGLAAFGGWLGNALPGWKVLTQAINIVVSLGVITLLFGLIFKLLPDTKIAWRDVWLGAGLTAALFTAGKYLISLYIAKSAVESSYGAAGALAALLVWVYYSSLTMLFGAEVAQVYARTRGSLMARHSISEAPPPPEMIDARAKSPARADEGAVPAIPSETIEKGYELLADKHGAKS